MKNTRSLFLALLVILADSCRVKVEEGPSPSFFKVIGTASSDQPVSVVPTSDGGMVICGTTGGVGTVEDLQRTDIFLTKINATSDLEWTRTYGGSRHEAGAGVCELAGGGYMVAGTTSSYGYDSLNHSKEGAIYLAGTDASGAMLWRRVYEETWDSDTISDHAACMIQTRDGNLAVGGGGSFRYLAFNIQDGCILKIKPDGQKVWFRNYQQTDLNINQGHSLVEDGSGDIISVISNFNGSRSELYRTSASGEAIWVKYYEEKLETYAVKITLNGADGFYILCNQNIPGTGSNIYIKKVDRYGNEIWNKSYPGAGLTEGKFMNVLPGGNILIAGSTEEEVNADADFYVLVIDPDGAVVMEKSFGSPGNESIIHVAPKANGGYTVVGQGTGKGTQNLDILLFKTDENWNVK